MSRPISSRTRSRRGASSPPLWVGRTGRGGTLLPLGSDGLHGVVENHELAQILGGPSLTGAVSALIALARARGGPNTITALPARIDQGGERTATAARAVGSEAVTSPLP